MHVGRFGLDDSRVDILRVGELEVVELVMFGAGAVHPDWPLRFDEDAPAVVDVDLVVIDEVELVVRDPEPVVFEVTGRFGRDMQEQIRTLTRWIVGRRNIRVLGAGIALQASASGTADAHMHIPHARGTLRCLGDIPLDHDRAWGRAFGLEDEIAHFDCADVAWFADLEHGSWRRLVGEGGTGSHDQGPYLPRHLDVTRHFDSRSDDIGTVIEVKDLIRGETVHGGLDRCGIIRNSIALGSC